MELTEASVGKLSFHGFPSYEPPEFQQYLLILPVERAKKQEKNFFVTAKQHYNTLLTLKIK